MRLLQLVLITTFIISCGKVTDAENIGLSYFPEVNLLKKGLVWKYYHHASKKDGQTQTDIVYVKSSLSSNVIYEEQYNAGFEVDYSHELKIEDHLWKLQNQQFFLYKNRDPFTEEPTVVQIDKNISIDWLANEAWIDKTNVVKGSGFRVITQQYANEDSISGTQKIKILKAKRDFIKIRGDDRDTFYYNLTSMYEEGLGLTKRTIESPEYKVLIELDELMTVAEFNRRRNNRMHRVGYIDTLVTLDDYKLFSPCYAPSKISDYYNEEKAEFKGGKGRLLAVLSEKLNQDLLRDASGYLTFRFVVNCKGEAGWFVTEEVDLAYQRIEFNKDLKMHLYSILKSEKEWTNLVVRKKPRDAYAYITFKISNGKISEILP